MTLTIIYVSGPSNTGKSETIRDFTSGHLKYERNAVGDVLGVFPMPLLNYTVGVSGYGDNREVVQWGLEFLAEYKDLRVMIVATRSEGDTIDEVQKFAKRNKALLLPPIVTVKLDSE